MSIWKWTVLYSLHALNNTPQINGIGPHQMGITKRSNNHSFAECSRGPIENSIKSLVKLYYNALAHNWTGSLNAQYVRACPAPNSSALQMQRLYALHINKRKVGENSFGNSLKHFVPFPGWGHAVTMTQPRVWNPHDAQDPEYDPPMRGLWQEPRSCQLGINQMLWKNTSLCLVNTCHSLLV